MAKAPGTYAPPPLLSILRTALRGRLERRLDEEIAPLRAAAQGLVVEQHQHRQALADLRERIRDAESFETGDFHGEMTVHAAWRRHPGVAKVFASRGLPDCPSCAVGVDETLAEAADGYQIPRDELIAELQALLRG